MPSETGREGEGRPSVSGGAALLCGSQHHLAGAAGAVRTLEHGMATLSPSEPVRGVRGLFRHAGGFEQHGAPSSDVRFDRDPRACIGGRRKRGQQGQALGRSRGGFSTKIHLKTDFDGLPITFDLTGGEAADSPHFETLMDLGPDVRPRAIVADKGYDSAGNRRLVRKRDSLTVIPYRRNSKAGQSASQGRSTGDGPASSRPSASSNASKASPSAAKRSPQTSVLSSPSPPPSS